MQSAHGDNYSSSYCCISVCKNYKDPHADVDLYPIPKSELEKELWVKAFNIPASVASDPTSRVCGAHFRYKYFLREKEEHLTPPSYPFTVLIAGNTGRKIITQSPSPHLQVSGNSQLKQNVYSMPIQSISSGSKGNALNSLNSFVYASNIPANSVKVVGDYNVVSNPSTSTHFNASQGSLLKKGNLMLECQEETLSAAQLSAPNNDWDGFNEAVMLLNHMPSTSQLQAPYVSTDNIDQLNSNTQYVPQTGSCRIEIPTTLSSPSLTPQFLHIPSSGTSLTSDINPIVNSANSFMDMSNYMPQNVLQSVSNMTPQTIPGQSQNSVATSAVPSTSELPPRIVSIESQAPGAENIKIVNSSRTALNPQFTEVPFTLSNNSEETSPEFASQNATSHNSHLNEVSRELPSPTLISDNNNQDIVSSADTTTDTVPLTISSVNTGASGDFILQPSPSFLQSYSDSSQPKVSEEIFPVLLERVDEELAGTSSVTKAVTPESILPLLPKVGEKEFTRAKSALSTSSTPLRSSTPTVTVSSDDESVDIPDLSNVAAVYGVESMPIVTATEQNSSVNLQPLAKNESLPYGSQIQIVNFPSNTNSTTDPTSFRPRIQVVTIPANTQCVAVGTTSQSGTTEFTRVNNATSLFGPPSTTFSLGDRSVDMAELSNVAAVYGGGSTPLVAKTEQKPSSNLRPLKPAVNFQPRTPSVNFQTLTNNESLPFGSKVQVVNFPNTNSGTITSSQKSYQFGPRIQVVNIPANAKCVTVSTSQSSMPAGASILRQYFEAKKSVENNQKTSGNTPILSKDSTPTNSNTLGPVIVDVISAKEGGLAYYTDDNSLGKNLAVQTDVNVLDHSESNMAVNVVNNAPKVNQASKVNQTSKVNIDEKILHSPANIVHKYSIFSMQKSIPIIPGGGQFSPDTNKLFSIKTIINKDRLAQAHALRQRLRTENYVENSVWWLIQKKYMPLNPPCTLCGCTSFTIDRNTKFFDGFCWTCRNIACQNQESIKRPKFFENFKFYTLEELLLLTYHWACQSDMEDIIQDVNMPIEKVWHYFNALQDLCRDIVEKKGVLGTQSKIEVAAVKFGNFFILGAMERLNRNTRLAALKVEEAFKTSQHFKLLEKWICKNTIVISESKIPDHFLLGVTKVSVGTKSDGFHICNITNYLIKNMISMFSKFKVEEMQLQVIEGFLYELQWRERFSQFSYQAFWSIFDHIAELNKDQANSTVQVSVGDIDLVNFVYLNSGFKDRWGSTYKTIESTVKNKVSKDFKELVTAARHKYGSLNLSELVKSKFWYEGMLNNLFQDLPEVPGGENNVTPKNLLSIKVNFAETSEDTEDAKADATSLGLRLSAEGFISSPVRWLVKRGFAKSKGPCYVCGTTSYLRENTKFLDGCSWSCQNKACKFENIFKRPQFYARFPMLPISQMSAGIFHWAIQSTIPRTLVDAPLDISKLAHLWRSFQVLCSTSLRKKKIRLGGRGWIVEVSMVQYGKLYILGAMERKTKHTLLRAFPADVKQQVPVFFKMISQWILPYSVIVINSTELFRMPEEYEVVIADTSIIDADHASFHVLNITTYLLKHISSMFGHLKADDVRVEVLQVYLDELMWRERFGKLPSNAFYNIVTDIFALENNVDVFSKMQGSAPANEGEPTLNNKDNNEEILMFDKLAVREENVTNDSPEVIVEESVTNQVIDPASLPELRIVLKRIPDEVLRYYNCLPKNLSKPSSSNMQDPMAAMKVSEFKSKARLLAKVPSKHKIYFDSCVIPKISILNPRTYSKSQHHSNVQSSSKSTKKSKVIKIKKEPKGEDCDVEIMDEIVQPDESPPKLLHVKSENTNVEFSNNVRTRNNMQIKSKRVNVTESDEQMCIECGKPVTIDHFMKKFLCMDCKHTVYTTCCCNSFMEHRGYLLFGKRMPRRTKEIYGLHKAIPLQDSYYCACGYSSNMGNKLASHMVKCKKSTCYCQADVS